MNTKKSFDKYYCHVAETVGGVHKTHHDTIYGFPAKSDDELYQRLMLEINQAGLSWEIILKKRTGLLDAYEQFEIEKIANYGKEKTNDLLNDSRIIRNKLKINAAIFNANVIIQIREKYGSFKEWLDSHFPKSKKEWIALFKKNFKFTGGEITNEFLTETGYLPGAHHPDCRIYEKALTAKPKWLELQ